MLDDKRRTGQIPVECPGSQKFSSIVSMRATLSYAKESAPFSPYLRLTCRKRAELLHDPPPEVQDGAVHARDLIGLNPALSVFIHSGDQRVEEPRHLVVVTMIATGAPLQTKAPRCLSTIRVWILRAGLADMRRTCATLLSTLRSVPAGTRQQKPSRRIYSPVELRNVRVDGT